MVYQVNKIPFEEAESFDGNAFFYYDDERVVKKNSGLHSKNIGFDYLCLEIYDDSHWWCVAFEVVCNSQFLVCVDKMMVFSGKNDCLYLYCLQSRRCLDCFATHNQFLSHQYYSKCAATQCQVNDRHGYIIVLNSQSLLVFDVAGVKSKVEHDMCCCFELSVVGSRILVRHDHAACVTYEYNLHTGSLLE